MDVPGFREEPLPLLSFEDRLSLSQTCVRLNHWVTRNVVVFRRATGRLHYAKYNPELDQYSRTSRLDKRKLPLEQEHLSAPTFQVGQVYRFA
jgi:hypothetical protein